ncbi:alpha/beta fold hydrolase [Bacillus badius]|uniref:alpha/beta fold hydrolase n=1 Tax=Bacillus badius TaxID=1455 RepID=UPI00059739B3|nr:alpha/beta fold hydrolase [Bacillus badius]KIL76632.1 putative cell surface hydrolase (putative) [Bacillus badius]
MTKRNKLLTASLLIALLIFISYGTLTANSKTNTPPPDVTVFVHGYKGTAVSFRSMLERFDKEHHWGKKVVTCRVTADGQVLLEESGPIPASGRLFVQLIFENNRASFDETAHWLSKALHALKQTYQFEQVNLVGHSMGGIVSVQFLEEYAKKPGYPFIHKLVVIGSPFSGLKDKDYLKKNSGPAAADLMPNSGALQQLAERKSAFPSDVKVLAIASTGDQLVSTNSVLSLKQIVPSAHFQKAVISDRSITHSGLHESEKVDRLIGQFLWQE